MDLSRFGANLRPTDVGLWISGSAGAVSFPEGGHDECFQGEDASFWFHHRNRCLIELLRAFPPAGVLLEIGGGNGFVAQALIRAGYETVLLEPGPAGARNALARGVSTVACSTFEAAAFRDGSLPAAGMFDVLEHIEDDAAFLTQLHRAMAPSGRLYLTVPAYQALWSEADEYAGHFRRYTLSEIGSRLAAAGFAVEWASYFFAPLVVPIFLLRALRRGGGLEVARDRAYRDHTHEDGLLTRGANALLAVEIALLRRRFRIPFGSSCLIVAHKVSIAAA